MSEKENKFTIRDERAKEGFLEYWADKGDFKKFSDFVNKRDKTISEVAFCTILKNRIFHGGILTKGAGMIKNGENGKGITSRWYAKTLNNRILSIGYIKSKISFFKGDAFKILEENLDNQDY